MADDWGVHTVWSLGARQVLWVATRPDAESVAQVGIDRQIGLSADPIQHGSIAEAFVEEAARSFSLPLSKVVSQHVMRYQPHRGTPAGRGRVWTSGAAAQLISPVLGVDDNLGMLEEQRDVRNLERRSGGAVVDSRGLQSTPRPTPAASAGRLRSQPTLLASQPGLVENTGRMPALDGSVLQSRKRRYTGEGKPAWGRD